MPSFIVKTSEVHLLLSAAQITHANTFQIHAFAEFGGAELTFTPEMTYDSYSDTIATISATGLIQAVALGETYGKLTYTLANEITHMVIRIVVHADIDLSAQTSTGQYLIYNGDDRITTYKSRTPDLEDDFLAIYYTPTVYAKFTDGQVGDITSHPYLKYEEVNTNGLPLSSPGDAYLLIDKDLFPGSTTEYYYPGQFMCTKTPATISPDMQAQRAIKITLYGAGTQLNNTSKTVLIRCEEELDTYRYVLRRLNTADPSAGPLTRILMLGEGYNKDEQTKLVQDCTDMMTFMQSQAPYNLLKDSIEFWCAPAPSGESGVTIPSYIHVASASSGQNDGLIPGGYNYDAYYPHSGLIKKAIEIVGVYNGTPAKEAEARTFYNSTEADGLKGGTTENSFILEWQRTRPAAFIKNRDTRFCLTLGKGRLSEAPSKSGGAPAKPYEYWMNYHETHAIGFDRRKAFIVAGGKSGNYYGASGAFINKYISSLREVGQTNPDQGTKGTLWVDISTENGYRRTFVAILINHPMRMGVNQNSFFASTVGNMGVLELSSPQNGVGFTNNVDLTGSTIPLATKATFVHEMTHYFDIGDEYSDSRNEGHENFDPSESEYNAHMEYANIDSFDRLKIDETTITQINPYKVKWNWSRIGVSSAVKEKPRILNNEIILTLYNKAEADKWIAVRDAATKVYVRTLDIPKQNLKEGVYDFGLLGEKDPFKLTVHTVNNSAEPYTLALNVLSPSLGTIPATELEEYLKATEKKLESLFKDGACVYTKKRGLYSVSSVHLKNNIQTPGFVTSKEGQTFDLKIKSNVPGCDKVLSVLLKINAGGTCTEAMLNPRKEADNKATLFLTDDQGIAESESAKWDNEWFLPNATITHPQLEFTFVPYDTTLSRINILDPGNGYSNDATITVTPANGVTTEVIMSPPSVFPEIDPSNNGGNFIFPVYLVAKDLRNIPEEEKGAGFRALVTEVSATGSIEKFNILNNGNGLYSTTDATKTRIDIITDDHDYILPAGGQAAEFEFDPVAYTTWIPVNNYGMDGTGTSSSVWANYAQGTLIRYTPIKYKKVGGVEKKGSGYKIPLGPMRFTLTRGPKNNSGELNNAAHVLGYLNDGKVDKVEIIYPGRGFELNDIIYIKADTYADSVFLLQGLMLDYYRRNKFNEIISKDDAFRTGDVDKMPVFKVTGVSPDPNKRITNLEIIDGGENLHYPTQPLTIMVSAAGTYYEYEVEGKFGKYDCTFKIPVPPPAAPSNERQIDKVYLYKIPDKVDDSWNLRIFGGKPDVTVPSTGGTCIPCNTAANFGEIIKKQGKGIKEIKITNAGTGFTDNPVVTVQGTLLGGGKAALVEPESYLFPRIVDPSVLKFMLQSKSPLVKATQNFETIQSALRQIKNQASPGKITLNTGKEDSLIALFEGAATYNKNAYRPSFNSLMRNGPSDDRDKMVLLNFVTMYYLVNYLNPSKLGQLDKDEYFNTINYTVK